jgi:hypothetical protein
MQKLCSTNTSKITMRTSTSNCDTTDNVASAVKCPCALNQAKTQTTAIKLKCITGHSRTAAYTTKVTRGGQRRRRSASIIGVQVLYEKKSTTENSSACVVVLAEPILTASNDKLDEILLSLLIFADSSVNMKRCMCYGKSIRLFACPSVTKRRS